MESSLDVLSGCSYQDGYCRLGDGSMVIWETTRNASCQLMPWVVLHGKFHDGYFVSNNQDVALTFTDKNVLELKTCNGSDALMSDQGIAVEFLDPVSR